MAASEATEASDGMSRRAFVAAGGAAAGIVALGASGATPARAAEKGSASADATTASGETTVGYDGTGVMPWLGEEPSISESDVSQTLECDVLVIGLGCAGVPAARAAAEAGAKVVALEASSALNSCASDMAVLGGQTQAKWGRGDGYLDPKTIVNMHMSESSHHCSQGIITRWTQESGGALDWLIAPASDLYVCSEEHEDVPQESQSSFLYPYYYPMLASYDYTKETMPCYPTSVGFSNLAAVMKENLQVAVDAGADVHYDTRAVELIVDGDGAVTGAYAQKLGESTYLKVTAKSVVLATGDYLADEGMVKYFAPQVVENQVPTMCFDVDANGDKTERGDGIRMGVWAGAKVEGWHAPMIHYMGSTMGNNGYLWLNLDGKRFMNEDIPGQQLENQLELQPQRTAYQIFDSAWPDQLQYFPAAHGTCCYYYDEVPSWYPNGLQLNIGSPAKLQSGIDSGACLTADTIDDLLAQMDGMDADAAKESIERYNELCKAGEDTDFYKSSQRLFALENPPFYAVKCTPAACLQILGGLESDADCHVYSTDRQVIPGLYVCGAPQGGRFNVQYPISLKGLSCSMCVTFGKIAGENAAAGK